MDPCLISDMVKVELWMAPRLSSAVETVDQERRPGVSFKLTGANVIARIEKILIYFPVEKKDNKNKKERFD